MSDLKATVHGLMGQARHDLATLVGFQSVASSEPEHVAGCASAAEALVGLLQAAGLKDAKLYDTPSPDQTVAYKSKAVFGSAPAPEGKSTVLLYCHYDVQPADYNDAWKLVEKDGRWYAHGSADCKGNIVAHLTALRALGNGHFPVGVKLVAEGSEEQGDGGLETFVTRHKDMFQSDAILVCDTGNAAVGR
jgi:cysteinylglycine-S-conjugate dipeptidase